MRDSLGDIERVQPWTGAIVCSRCIEKRTVVEKYGIGDARIVVGDSLRAAGAIRSYAPDVHLVRRQSMREIQKSGVG
jgi:hypothetical protein